MNNEIVQSKQPHAKVCSFANYLQTKKNINEKTKPTNTRIGNKEMGIWGGSYYIPDENQEEFLTVYANEIKNGTKEYLTETQLETDSSILIDIDLRFNYSVKNRIYTESHIDDLKNLYLEELKKIYQFDEQPFNLYIFEKNNVNPIQEKNITKDGIHMIIGIKTKREEQIYLRDKIILQIKELWNDLPIINTWEEIFDIGISQGICNWQLYGSTKPGYETYKLTKQYKITFDESDQDFIIEKEKVPEIITLDLLKKISARCQTNPFYFNRGDFINHISTNNLLNNSHKQNTVKNKTQSSSIQIEEIFNIRNKDNLNQQVALFLEHIDTINYELRETYNYTMALPEKYYGTGSFPYWIKVGWALRNINDKLFIVWIEFSAKWEQFNYSSIMELYEKWCNFDIGNSHGLTRRSIMHWLKTDNPNVYSQIRQQSVEYYINESLKNPKCGDVDIANVLYEFFKDQYVCTSIRGDIWYNFCDHRWRLDEKGTSLRQHISDELRGVYMRLAIEKKQKGLTSTEEEKEKIAPIINKLQEVIKKLGQTTEKDHIMKEAKEKFYDRGGVFINKLDTNPYILCFKNGVIDFKEKVFRDGRPEDCVSKCTNLIYKKDFNELNPTTHDLKIMTEINDFMHKLFPLKDLFDYMWEHLASTLIGTSINQTFHMYIGKGRNGKSVLMDLMTKTLGDYKGDVPLSIITASRTKPGGLNPELVELKGIRYAVMQEPSPNEKINVGPMKMLTGGKDIIQCRAPYMPETVRYNPQFKLCLCTNTFMEINSLDEGTWRRIRVVEFMSLFTENPIEGDLEKPYQFKVEEIDEKFDSWKEIFISMLVNIVKRTNGAVQNCDRVMQASNSYKGDQDFIGSFIREMIINDPFGKINQIQLRAEFEKWYANMYDARTMPKPKDVYDYFDKKYGKRSLNQPWTGINIIRYEPSDEGSQPDTTEADFTSS